MDRLPEQVVAWHNSHPLAKRISIYDVHTIGVVALPFMRSGSAAMPARGPIEPVLTDAVSSESLAAWGTEESTIAANTNAAQLDALADQEELPPGADRPAWRQRLLGLFKRGAAGSGNGNGNGNDSWPAFSERFVENLSARRVAGFAERHGYSVRPGDATWPHRVVPIDDQLMSRGGAVGGAWPFEMYLMSAAIDAGRSRSRVLAGRSAGAALPPIIGRRCLDAKRVGVAALLPLCILSAAGTAWWNRGAGHEDAVMAAASAASAPASAPASAASGPIRQAEAASQAASGLATAMASEASAVASSAPAETAVVTAQAAASASMEAPASAPSPIPDIRPRFVEMARPPGDKEPALLAATKPPAAASAAVPSAAVAKAEAVPSPAAASSNRQMAAAKPAPAASEAMTLPITPVKPDIQEAAAKGTPVVALVAPPMRSKAEAEATLARMRELVLPLQPDPQLMQAQIFESPEGWRPAVWPFSSRIEAQLVNATLVARGLHTKAVNF